MATVTPAPVATPTRKPRAGKSVAGVSKPPQQAVIEIPAGEPVPKDPMEMPFFDMLHIFTETQWEELFVYLYRLEPRIFNSTDHSNIERITRPFDEEYVRLKHGGGKYLAWLKRGQATVRKFTFTIGGEPILQPGQKASAAPAAANPAPAAPALPTATAQEDLLARIVEQVFKAQQERNLPQAEAIKTVIDTMRQANTSAIEMMSNSLRSQQGSPTGNALGDKLAEAFISQMTTGKKEKDGVEETLKLVQLLRTLDGEKDQPKNLLDQVKELKELGIDLLGAGGGKDKSGAWDAAASLGTQLIAKIPDVVREFKELRAHDVEIARINERVVSMRIGAGLPAGPQPSAPGGPPARSTPAVTHGVPVPPGTPSTREVAANPPLDLSVLDQIATLIARSFEGGDGGDEAAHIVYRVFPIEVEQLLPFLGSVDKVVEMASMSPMLAPLLNDPEFPCFAEDFVKELTGQNDVEEGGEADQDQGADAKAPVTSKPS